jgi:dTDP-4-dehydrorhamnose reductase
MSLSSSHNTYSATQSTLDATSQDATSQPHLVIGASGQVGEHLLNTLRAQNLSTVGTYCSHEVAGMEPLDVRDAAQVVALMTRLQPAVVYLPASLTNVDWCEQHPDEGYAINVRGVQHVTHAANAVGAKLVYFSSDYIFDGYDGPYREDAAANPLCEYGRQKVMAEHYVALNAPQSLIVRTTVVYGWERQGKNFIQRLRDTLSAGNTMRAPVDQIGSPTYAPDLARASVELVQRQATGAYHVVGSELANRYEFACEAARVFGLDETLIEPVETAVLQQPAARPLRAGMLIDKAVQKLGRPLLSYCDGLRVMAAEAKEQQAAKDNK